MALISLIFISGNCWTGGCERTWCKQSLRQIKVQTAREQTLAQQANQWLICDTSALVTSFYSLALFGAIAPALACLADRAYAATFVCAPDFPFVQDGTRRDDRFRQRQHAWYIHELNKRGIAYTLLSGAHDLRLLQAAQALQQLRHVVA